MLKKRNAEDEMLENIKEYGKSYQGYGDMIKYLNGEVLTLKQSVKAKCFDCMGFYADGKNDCKLTTCSLYPFMPFNEKGPRRIKQRKAFTEEQKAALKERFAKARADKK